MQRKIFLKNGLLAGLGLPLFKSGLSNSTEIPGEPDDGVTRLPPFLKAGDTIAITSPAGYITLEEIQPALVQMLSWGLVIRVGKTIGQRDGTFGGTDNARREDFQELMDDPSVKAIMCARGGYGFIRILDQLDFNGFRLSPKWIIGFSDITFLHAHLNRVVKVASIHSKMCNSFPENWVVSDPLQQETILSIRDQLFGKKMLFRIPPNTNNRIGTATGELIGGNCKTIESMAGSVSDLKTAQKILFLEDTGEYLYSIDRMFWNLKRTGKMDDLAGLIIGGFKIKPSEDPSEEFNRDLYQIILEKIADCTYPVLFDFPVGHQRNNYALRCGVKVNLVVNNDGGLLQE